MAQHAEHGKAFNAAVTQLGGKAQNDPDPTLLTVVNNAKPGLTDAGKVVDPCLVPIGAGHHGAPGQAGDVKREFTGIHDGDSTAH